MADGLVKRIRRSRAPAAISPFSVFDDCELPSWGEMQYDSPAKSATANVSNDIGRIAANIAQRFYPDNGNLTWPDDYSSKAKAMRKEAGDAFRVELALCRALTTALVTALVILNLKSCCLS